MKTKIKGCGKRNPDGITFCGVIYKGVFEHLKYCRDCQIKKEQKQ